MLLSAELQEDYGQGIVERNKADLHYYDIVESRVVPFLIDFTIPNIPTGIRKGRAFISKRLFDGRCEF